MAVKKRGTYPVRKKRSNKSTKKSTSNRMKWGVLIVILVGFGLWFGLVFKDGIQYVFHKPPHALASHAIYDMRNVEVLNRHPEHLIGFDVSHYQGIIDWEAVDSISGVRALDFVFVRATMGHDGEDRGFEMNWRGARANHFIRGAYHYYRPDENSEMQAYHFIKKVRLSTGDLPPVLDIEELPKKQSMDSLRIGLKRWMHLVEQEYQVKPILYSGSHYYEKHLREWFPDHLIWIANYNFFVEEIKDEWNFWQFTEKGVIKGIDGKVDVNIFNGNRTDMRKLLIR